MKTSSILFLYTAILFFPSFAYMAKEYREPNIPWTNISSISQSPYKDAEMYEMKFRNDAFCRIPWNSKVLISLLDIFEEAYILKWNPWEDVEFIKYCSQLTEVSIFAQNMNGKTYKLQSIVGNHHPECSHPRMLTTGWYGIYSLPNKYFRPWFFLPELVVDKNYFILDHDRKVWVSASAYEIQQIYKERMDLIQSLPECQPNIRLKK